MESVSFAMAAAVSAQDPLKEEEEEPPLQTLICKSAALGDLEAVKKGLERSPTDLVNAVDEQVRVILRWRLSTSPCQPVTSSCKRHCELCRAILRYTGPLSTTM